jgi:hypothetical protein
MKKLLLLIAAIFALAVAAHAGELDDLKKKTAEQDATIKIQTFQILQLEFQQSGCNDKLNALVKAQDEAKKATEALKPAKPEEKKKGN